MSGADSRDRDQARQAAAASFQRLVWVRADGSRVVVEADGEVWLEMGRRRTLVASLTAAELADLEQRLTAAGAASWPSTMSAATGPCLRVESTAGARLLPLPASDPAVAGVLRLLEGWAR
jgi:hypothetical protein